jgi:putative ABC transport system permease protein
MFKNYIVVALRQLKEYKAYSSINIFGLALGLTVFILTVINAAYNMSFDSFHENSDRMYGVVQIKTSGDDSLHHSAVLPGPLLPALRSEFPQIEDSTRFMGSSRLIIKHKNEKIYENGVLFVDPNFLSFFTFPMIKGNLDTCLAKPNSIILTETSALKYFGSEDPLGRYLTIDNKVDAKVTGVVQDNPPNSTIRFDFLVSMATAKSIFKYLESWQVDRMAAYVLLSKGINPLEFNKKLPAFIDKYMPEPESKHLQKRMYLMPIEEFYAKAESINLSSYLRWDVPYETWIWFVAMAMALLLVVCINFMNLSTARYSNRAREVGMRKVVGANKFQLVKQFIGESVLISILSLPLAFVIYEFIRPVFISYFGYQMDLYFWHYPSIILFIFIFTITLGIFTGIYPAFFLSAFSPIHVLKGNLKRGSKSGRLRKTLVVMQFAISILLIVFTIVIKDQMSYLEKVDLGYRRDKIAVIPLVGKAKRNYELLKVDLVRHRELESASGARRYPISWWGRGQVIPQGYEKNRPWMMDCYGVDYGFIELLKMEVVQGRSFSKHFLDKNSFVINEMAVSQLQWGENPLGKELNVDGRKGRVIGVVKDYLFKNPHYKVSPAVLILQPDNVNYLHVKYKKDLNSQLIGYIKRIWNQHAPNLPFEISTLDTKFEISTSYIDIMSGSFGAIGILAIFISCFGLLGMASYSVARRTKEIGIRKVLGSSVFGIIRLLLSEFLFLVLLSNLISWPITYFCLKGFLRYAWSYPIGIGVGCFIFATLLSVITAIIAVASQTVKAAYTNPVEVLKYE